jgi:hypothetical protein
MNAQAHRWVVILTAGRMENACGQCDREGGHEHLSQGGFAHPALSTIRIGRRIVPRERICVLVTARHHHHWWPLHAVVDRENLIEEPEYRGTAIGILLATLTILDRDPFAQILFLAAGNNRASDAVIADGLPNIMNYLSSHALELLLAGVETGHAESDLGFVAPGGCLADSAYKVHYLAETRVPHFADGGVTGSLYDTIAFGGWGLAILSTLRQRLPTIVEDMNTALAHDTRQGHNGGALRDMYARLPTIGFVSAVIGAGGFILRLVQIRRSDPLLLEAESLICKSVRPAGMSGSSHNEAASCFSYPRNSIV